MSTQLPSGITLKDLGAKVRQKELDLVKLLGRTPVLVFRRKDDDSESPVYSTPEGGTAVGQEAPSKTSVFRWDEAGASAGGLESAVVVPLTPTHRNLLEDQVLVGRAATNDIRLISPQVSKLHLRFLHDDGAWKLVDEGSSNGTRLNGIDLEPQRAYRLESSDEITIGDVVVLYLDAEALLDLCSIVR